MSEADLSLIAVGLLCAGIPLLLFVRMLWRDRAWNRLATLMNLHPAPGARTDEMVVTPLQGQRDGRYIQLWVQHGAGERNETMVAVSLNPPLQLGLMGAAVTWQQSADKMYGAFKTLTSTTGLILTAMEHAFTPPESTKPVFPDHDRLNQKYTFRALVPTQAKSFVDSKADALLAARKPRWSVYIQDYSVALSPGTGTITNPKKLEQAITEGIKLARALESR